MSSNLIICCGRSVSVPMVNVDYSSFKKMYELGYHKIENECNDFTFALKGMKENLK